MAGAGSELPTHASLHSTRVDLSLTSFAGTDRVLRQGGRFHRPPTTWRRRRHAMPDQIFPYRSLSLTATPFAFEVASDLATLVV